MLPDTVLCTNMVFGSPEARPLKMDEERAEDGEVFVIAFPELPTPCWISGISVVRWNAVNAIGTELINRVAWDLAGMQLPFNQS